MRRALLATIALLAIIATLAYATAYPYRYAIFNIPIAPPVIRFEDPGISGVLVELLRGNTIARVAVNATRTLLLEHRSAVFYDDFETNPFAAGRLVSLTCTWGFSPTNRSVSISAYSRSNATWNYWCIVVVNPAFLNVTPYVLNGSTIYVAYLAWRTSFTPMFELPPPEIRLDTVWVNSTGVFYATGFRVALVEGRRGDYHYSNMSFVNTTTIPWSSQSNITTAFMFEYEYLYHVSTGVNFTTRNITHYVNESHVYTAVILPGYYRAPYAVGIGYRVNTTWWSGTVYFDSLILTVNHPPWYINVTGLPDGYTVVLKNGTGYAVANATSFGGFARLVVTHQSPIDLVAYGVLTRNAYIFRNATLEVYEPAGRLVTSRKFDFVLGGDRYRFASVFENIILSVYSNMSTGLRCMLANASASYTPLVNSSIGLTTWNGLRTAVNITVINGIVVSHETSVIEINPPLTWTGKWLVTNITGRFELPVFTNYTVVFNFIWWNSEGVRALYPINITVIG